jgi:hypothetical protein
VDRTPAKAEADVDHHIKIKKEFNEIMTQVDTPPAKAEQQMEE